MKLNEIKRRQYAQGYYFTLSEEKELQEKGYKLVSANDSSERDLLADIYKAANYFTRVSFGTTMVRGLYNYFIWVKPKRNADDELLKNLLAQKENGAQEEPVNTSIAQQVKDKAIQYLQSEIDTYVYQEMGTREFYETYANYVSLFETTIGKPNYKAVKKDLTQFLEGQFDTNVFTSNFDIVTEDETVIAYKDWFTEVKNTVFKK